MTKELEALERGIIEFEKNLEDDPNNEWLKRTITGMKKCYQRLEAIDNAKPSEALESLDKVIDYLNNVYDYKEIKEEIRKDIDTIKQALKRLEKYDELKPILVGILKGCKLRYEATHEPNMRLYMSKELCEKIDDFLKRLFDEQDN